MVEVEADPGDIDSIDDLRTALDIVAEIKYQPNNWQMSIIEPKILNIDGDDVIYFYMIWDVCRVTPESTFEMTIYN